MKRSLFSALLFFISYNGVEAQDTMQAKDAAVIDSAAILNDLMSLLQAAEAPSSYGMVSVGMGNRLFSLHNNRLNANQSSTSTLVFNPSIGYFHKSGFSISAGSSLLNDIKKGFGPTQFSVTPAFDLSGSKNWEAGISYSHYFIRDKYSSYSSPIQNDVYAYVNYKKWFIKPGIALGYSTGKYTEINKFTIQLTGNTYIDTGTYTLKAFSLMAVAGHDFEWDHLFGKKDAFSFSPSFMMNFGSDSTGNISHTVFPNLIRFLKRKNKFRRLTGSNKFGVQSAALSLDFTYSIGNFTILPQLYLDYYIPETTDARLTQTFTLSVGYTF